MMTSAEAIAQYRTFIVAASKRGRNVHDENYTCISP